MQKRNPGNQTATQQTRKEYQRRKRLARKAKFEIALEKRVKVLVKEISRLNQLIKQNEAEKKQHESKV
jgi:hypothetical protein